MAQSQGWQIKASCYTWSQFLPTWASPQGSLGGLPTWQLASEPK
jgi:hypothetical protein